MKHTLSLTTYLTRVGLIAALIAPVLAPLGRPLSAASSARMDVLAGALAGQASLEDAGVRRALAAMSGELSRAERQTLADVYYRQIIADQTDLEAFARLAELASDLSGAKADEFMLDMSRLTLDATSNWQALLAGPWGRAKLQIHARLPWFPGYPAMGRFGCQGFARADGGNQVQHFWYAAAVSYRYGAELAELQARYHEWNAPGLLNLLPGTGHGAGSDLDLVLSSQGIALGRALATGRMDVTEVADWMRENLS